MSGAGNSKLLHILGLRAPAGAGEDLAVEIIAIQYVQINSDNDKKNILTVGLSALAITQKKTKQTVDGDRRTLA